MRIHLRTAAILLSVVTAGASIAGPVSAAPASPFDEAAAALLAPVAVPVGWSTLGNAAGPLAAGTGMNVTFTLQSRDPQGLAAFAKHQVEDKPMPKETWKFEDADKHTTTLIVHPDKSVKSMRYWTATSPTRDFRQSLWASQDVTPKGECRIEAAAGSEYKAVLADADYEIGGLKYTRTTQIKMLEPKQ